MKSKLIVLMAIISVAVILLASYLVSINLNPTTTSTVSPSPTPYPYIKNPPTYFTELSQYQVNVTQGESFQINLTITSLFNETKTFTLEVQLAGYANSAWDPSKDSYKVYNATFGQQQIVLDPQEKAETNVTINIADDAPLGKYLFYITNMSLDVTVNPKN